MTGWIFRKTRKLHAITMGLTVFSWFILGIRYGWGYCFCTDWHWQVRDALGRPIQSYSYIHFLILEITGADLPPQLVDFAVLAVFLFCVGMAVFMNVRDFRNRKASAADVRH